MPEKHPNKPWLPIGFTPEQGEKGRNQQRAAKQDRRNKFLAAIERGNSPRQACVKAGITYRTYKEWRKDPEFLDDLEGAEEAGVAVIEDALRESALNGNVPAQTFVLTNRAPRRWRSGTDSKVTVENHHRLELTADAAAERLALLVGKIEEQKSLLSLDDPDIIDVEPINEEEND